MTVADNGAVIDNEGKCLAPPGTRITMSGELYIVNKDGICEPEKKEKK